MTVVKKLGGGNYTCEDCGETHYGSTIHTCSPQIRDGRTAINCVAKFYCTDREDMNCKYYEEGEKYQCKNNYGEFCQSGRANIEAMRIAQNQRIFIK